MNIPMAMDLFDAGLDICLIMLVHRAGSRMVNHPGINKIGEFQGKSLLIPHTLSVQHMLLHQFMSANGMVLESSATTAGVLAEPVPPRLMPEMMALDQEGDIAGFMTADPYGTLMVDQGYGAPLLTSQDLWENHPCCGFVVEKRLVDKEGSALLDLVRLFFRTAAALDTYTRGIEPLDENILDLAAAFLNQPQTITAEALKASRVKFTPALLLPDPDLLNIVGRYMSDSMGILSGNTDLDGFIKPDLAQKALGELAP
ncbi:MAG: ABC transporter substrate-binding protein [Desulfobacter sp.]|nr:MAG: ABC transporter substrate-binding protein [Desulfobacter sp.]